MYAVKPRSEIQLTDEVTFEARFKNIFDHGTDGALSIDISAIHEVERAA